MEGAATQGHQVPDKTAAALDYYSGQLSEVQAAVLRECRAGRDAETQRNETDSRTAHAERGVSTEQICERLRFDATGREVEHAIRWLGGEGLIFATTGSEDYWL